jgi:peptide/nickel transport system permease protein
MTAYLIRRLAGVALVVWATSLLIFAIVHILPGDVAYAMLGEFATQASLDALRLRLGLNDPLWLQYWRWLSGALHGDLGISLTMDRPAGPIIIEALGRSSILAGAAFAIVAGGGVALGIHAATHQGRPADRLLTLAQFIFIAVPDFFWGILAIVTFAAWLGWLPATGYAPLAEGIGGFLAHLVMPVAVLSIGLVAHVSRLTRAAMLEALRSRYVLMARAKGLSERRVLWRHAAPNAMLPTITILAIDFGLLIGGVVVIESVFAYPGLGRLLVFAIERHDLPLLQAGMLVLTTIYALANLAADLAYAILNPRIRYSQAA